MNGIPLNRILLLVLLPVVAYILFVEGQHYDPALIRFTGDDLASGSHSALLPERVGPFVRSGPLRIFSKDNLYEYVNGHAEYFLGAGFESLVVGDYLREGSPTGQADLVADIYDMGKPLYASTVLVDEIGGEPDTLTFGAVGANTGQGISFVSGKYYVRIGVFRADVPKEEFASSIYGLLGPAPEAVTPETRLPELPGAGPVHFVKESYRGLDFVNNIQERAYTINNTSVKVALAAGSQTEMGLLRDAYLSFFRESGVTVEILHIQGQDVRKIADPYEGDWYLVEMPGVLFSIYGVSDVAMLDALFTALWPPGGPATGEEGL